MVQGTSGTNDISAAARLARWVPIAGWLPRYAVADLPRDLAAGAVLTAVLIPVGMGYAQAAGLPAIHGLYATIVPLCAYAVFGPSRILVVGPDSSLVGIIAATVAPLAAGDADRAVALTGALSLLSGLLCAVAGAARFGFVTDLLSTPIRLGFLNGIALTVLVGQAPKVLGVHAHGDSLIAQVLSTAQAIGDGQLNRPALAIGACCLASILVLRRWAPRVPGVLVAVVGASLAVLWLDLDRTVKVVGVLPTGLPAFAWPSVSLAEVRALFPGALAIALVAFADTSVLSRAYAARRGTDVDGDQELIALGATHISAGLFQGFSTSGSSSRTPVAEAAGARSQLTALAGALCVAVLLIAAPGVVRTLPAAALGAIVIAACLTLVDVAGLRRLWSLRRHEFGLATVSFLGVALVGVIEGIFLAVVLALFAFVWRAWHPYVAVLGRVDGLKGYHDVSRYPLARRVPGLVLFRWDAPLFFANAAIFRRTVIAAVDAAPDRTRWVVVAAEPVTDLDVTAADALVDLERDLSQRGVELAFAEMKDPIKDLMKRFGVFSVIGSEQFFPTVGQAVDAYLEATGVAWIDWDERVAGAASGLHAAVGVGGRPDSQPP